MNLLKDAWVPVKYEGAAQQITLKELLCTDDHYVLSHPRDDMELSALQLLVCLAQCIFMPADKAGVVERIRRPMEPADYDAGIAKCAEWFSLDHQATPFMQDVNAKDEVETGIQKLFPGMPEGGNTATLFVDTNAIERACPSCVALALFNQATCSPSFGGGTKNPLRGSAPMTLLVYDADLRKMIWKNVLDKEWLLVNNGEKQLSGENTPVWVDKIKAKSRVAMEKIGLLRGLFWQPAYLYVEWEKSETPQRCSCCGTETNIYSERFRKNKFVYDLTDAAWIHPHSPYVLNEKQHTLMPLSFNKDRDIPLWGRLTDILPLGEDTDMLKSWPLAVKHYNGLRAYDSPLPLVLGGYRNNKASVVERRHEVISVAAGWIKDRDKLSELHSLIRLALEFRDALGKSVYAFGKALDQSAQLPEGIANGARTAFYQATEAVLHKFIASGSQPGTALELSTELRRQCLDIFSASAAPYLSSVKAIKASAQSGKMLMSKLNSIVNRQKTDGTKGGNETQ